MRNFRRLLNQPGIRYNTLLSNFGHLREVKDHRKLKTFIFESGRGLLREVVASGGSTVMLMRSNFLKVQEYILYIATSRDYVVLYQETGHTYMYMSKTLSEHWQFCQVTLKKQDNSIHP